MSERDKLIDKIANYLRENLPSGDDKAFWNDRRRVEDHLTEVLRRKMHIGVPRMDFTFDDETGVVLVEIHKPVIRWRDGDDDRTVERVSEESD